MASQETQETQTAASSSSVIELPHVAGREHRDSGPRGYLAFHDHPGVPVDFFDDLFPVLSLLLGVVGPMLGLTDTSAYTTDLELSSHHGGECTKRRPRTQAAPERKGTRGLPG